MSLALRPYDFAPAQPYRRRELPSEISILTWNVDAYGPHRRARIRLLLDACAYNLRERPGHVPAPCVICLQEVCVEALRELLAHGWVRTHFTVLGSVPRDDWPVGASHGCVALVSHTVPLHQAHSVHFGRLSAQRRGALLLDVLMRGRGGTAVKLRLAGSHLEAGGGTMARAMRAWQVAAVAAHVVGRHSVLGGVLLGDMNALGQQDEEAFARAGLVDAWTTASKAEVPSGGCTWWPRAGAVSVGREHAWPPGRLDRILRAPFVPAVELRRIKRVVAVTTPDGEHASDHCGLMCKVRIRRELL
ncbi:Endonuclease/exonuclease/phosphatase [Vararia minispora EC-137]|uniref:Endonuclease/exonuclease/phosphatase n=1 Tax=Vararia minispora EC-137 TaxID=1314806 RepID=A0ACB8Q5T7_9AGAM|nr:Endonuclease/exonuclease/phosphatase [Vararia minispora EC-137]